MNSVIDIHSNGQYPANALSNFAEYEFYVDEVKCLSMEGLLQSLKFKNPKKQKKICLMSGNEAKNAPRRSFSQLRWRTTHNLYWQGRRINRFSDEYQMLLDRAYCELSKNRDFIKALDETAEKELVHSIGKNDSRKTVLTEYEFVLRLKRIRKKVHKR